MAQYTLLGNKFLGHNDTIFETIMLSDIKGKVINPASGTPVPNGFHTFNNFDTNVNAGFGINGTEIPAFALRVKPGSGTEFNLINMNITANSQDSSVLGYTWHMNPTINNAFSWTDLDGSGIEYVAFDDADGTPNSITGGTKVHSHTLVGKSASELTPEMKTTPFTDGGFTLVLTIKRLDSTAKTDFWFNLTMTV